MNKILFSIVLVMGLCFSLQAQYKVYDFMLRGASYQTMNFNQWVNVSASVMYFMGNVGIGTNDPTAGLHIASTFRLQNNGAAAGKVLTSDVNGNATWQTLPLQSTYPTTSTPTPAAGFAIVWFDGTNLKVIKNVGGTTTTLVIF